MISNIHTAEYYDEIQKRFEELNVIDNFMFNELMLQEESKAKAFCQALLEPIIGKKVKIQKLNAQRIVQGKDMKHHGIQMDAYIHVPVDAKGQPLSDTEDIEVSVGESVYDIEPNKYKDESDEKRTRFYHALIDRDILKSGVSYDKLPQVVVIMILPYDPFGLDSMIYTVKRHCIEEPDMPYEDGDITIYLYTNGTRNIPSQSLKDMLKYVTESTDENAVSNETKCIQNMIADIKHDSRIGVKYMQSWELEGFLKKQGREEMRAEMQHLLDEKDAQMQKKDAEMQKKDAEMQKKDAEMQKKDAEINRLKQLLATQG